MKEPHVDTENGGKKTIVSAPQNRRQRAGLTFKAAVINICVDTESDNVLCELGSL